MHRRRPLPLPALSALTIALWPAVAAADPQCESPFVNVGCFVFSLVAAAFFMAPVGIVAAIVIFVVGNRKAKGQSGGIVLTALGALIVPVVSLLALMALTPKAELLPQFLCILVVTAAYVAIALRTLIQRAKAAAPPR